MKKLISIGILMTMLFSIVVLFSGCEWMLSDKKLMQMKEDYIKQFNIEGKEADDVLLEFYAGNFHGYEVVMLDAGEHWPYYDPIYQTEIYFGVSINYYDKNRLLAYKDGFFYTLQECRENWRLNIVDFFIISTQFNSKMNAYYKLVDKYDFDNMYFYDGYVTDENIHIPEYDNDSEYSSIKVNMISIFGPTGNDIPLSYFGTKYFEAITDITIYPYGSKCYELQLRNPGKTNYLEAIEHLKTVLGVYVINYIRTGLPPAALPNDYSDDVLINWGLDLINVEKVWDFTTGSDAVRVGVIDTGIYTPHPELSFNSAPGVDFVNTNGSATDDPTGHGTHVAGIIGAQGNNSLGITGVNWDVTLIPFQTVLAYEGRPFVMEGKLDYEVFYEIYQTETHFNVAFPDTSLESAVAAINYLEGLSEDNSIQIMAISCKTAS